MPKTMPRVMDLTTPLGEDVLLFHGMHAREEMGRLSEYDPAPSNSSTVKTSRPPGRNAFAAAATTSSSGPKYTRVSADTITSNAAVQSRRYAVNSTLYSSS